MGEETFERLQHLIHQINTDDLSSILQLMQTYTTGETSFDKEKAHILADLLMARLLLEVSEMIPAEYRSIISQIITSYKEGAEEHWWYA